MKGDDIQGYQTIQPHGSKDEEKWDTFEMDISIFFVDCFQQIVFILNVLNRGKSPQNLHTKDRPKYISHRAMSFGMLCTSGPISSVTV